MSGFETGREILSYVALGDSFTEGMDDPYPDSASTPHGRYRGWADRLAEHLGADGTEVRYANLAVRGKLIRQIVEEQVPLAVEWRPDLVTICAGGNDIIRPGGDPDLVARVFEAAVRRLRATGAHIVIFTGMDTGFQPVMRHLRGKVATYNMHLRGIADDHGCDVVDLWSMKVLQDRRAWSVDRLHLSPEGHRRVALKVCEVLGVAAAGDWREPWPADGPRDWRAARQEDLSWAREYLVPWIGRRLTGRSSGDGLAPKRPRLERLEALERMQDAARRVAADTERGV
ncbi:SGNH/GDSL hydrolase family protein [Streptomonospora nanhaiensis]|uniref:Lysophospholipase L1-like esterase n=1 Tax=Streptomonospora nanhaiensis TaxID=1323731 RepID=A0A853BIT5_9ACTN|nr:SGNH/GDSL hydrolase family protein [Streptomonospora nanhaiensis]MBV2363041.1 SGNH/GDSL hydrolase family protein [Streptomonospora nanhaiensis]MBX9387084.1 SGNH/GDSL hydrolase family protein [Streptomonospora nanhaiensis]NYI95408.1 lysophospholipase L1-like esterase [Streptomonospora nanhaiensis]